jgi:hypothetical protein
MNFQKVSMEISKSAEKKGDKRVPVGTVEILVPVLKDIAAIVAGASIKKDDKGQEIFEDGLPVYEDEKADWIQSAILSQIKAQARNKLVPGTVTLKPDQKIPETWEELCAEGTRGPGAGLKLLQDFRKAFQEWIAKQGLSEAATKTLVTFVSNRSALECQTATTKAKVAARLNAFAESLSEEDMERFLRPLENAIAGTAETANPMDEI